jgi:hypothetical protein
MTSYVDSTAAFNIMQQVENHISRVDGVDISNLSLISSMRVETLLKLYLQKSGWNTAWFISSKRKRGNADPVFIRDTLLARRVSLICLLVSFIYTATSGYTLINGITTITYVGDMDLSNSTFKYNAESIW